MSLLNSVKSIFRNQSIINYTGGTNYEELPLGFFRVETATNKESLGYRNTTGWLSWNCGETVVDGDNRVTLSVPRESLPLVRLNFRGQSAGTVVGDQRIIDTDDLSWNGEVEYDGGRIREGVDYEAV